MSSGSTLLALLALALAGCTNGLDAFTCHRDSACKPGQTCVDSSCASVDSSCPSGLRWDKTSGGRTNQCAEIPDLSATDPNCDNGTLDPGETCDDGAGSPVPCPLACDDGEPCTLDTVVGSRCSRACSFAFVAEGGACRIASSGADGQCHNHSCCAGCFDGEGCRPGASPTDCGIGGAACRDCTTNECIVAECKADGSCGTTPAVNKPCASGGGACTGGACCTTCLSSSGGCDATGSTFGVCGGGGNACVDCAQTTATSCGASGTLGNRCIGCAVDCAGKSCGSDGCGGSCGACPSNMTCDSVSHTCQCSALTEGTDIDCADGLDNDCDGKTDCDDAKPSGPTCAERRCGIGRYCVQSAGVYTCKSGCQVKDVNGHTVAVPAGAINNSNSCLVCDPTQSETSWSPVLDGTTCTDFPLGRPGTCRQARCCPGCWQGLVCVDPLSLSLSQCGGAGSNCASCNRCSENCGGSIGCVSFMTSTPVTCGPSLCCPGSGPLDDTCLVQINPVSYTCF